VGRRPEHVQAANIASTTASARGHVTSSLEGWRNQEQNKTKIESKTGVEDEVNFRPNQIGRSEGKSYDSLWDVNSSDCECGCR
jgi:hypothetical protein